MESDGNNSTLILGFSPFVFVVDALPDNTQPESLCRVPQEDVVGRDVDELNKGNAEVLLSASGCFEMEGFTSSVA